MAERGTARRQAFDAVGRTQHWRDTYAGLSAYERHQRLLQHLGHYEAGAPAVAGPNPSADAAAAAALAATRSDADVLREAHRFLRRPEDDAAGTWETRLARRYYARLFKEYAIADLSRAAEGAVGLRWRTKAEVESGKGQFLCGARGCNAAEGLASYEVLFAYNEANERRSALVKVRACPECAAKLATARGGGGRSGGRSGGETGRRRERSHKRKRSRGRSRSRSRSRSDSGDSEHQRRRRRRRHRRDRDREGGRRHRRSRSASASDSSASDSSGSGSGGGSGQGGTGRPPRRAPEPTDADIERFVDEMFD
jgi:hypothetical protein